MGAFRRLSQEIRFVVPPRIVVDGSGVELWGGHSPSYSGAAQPVVCNFPTHVATVSRPSRGQPRGPGQERLSNGGLSTVTEIRQLKSEPSENDTRVAFPANRDESAGHCVQGISISQMGTRLATVCCRVVVSGRPGVAEVHHVLASHDKIPDAGNNPRTICVYYSMRTDDGSVTPPSFP